MWRRRYLPLLSPNTPVGSTSSCWSAYSSEVHRIEYGEESGTGYLVWVTFRAAWAQQILFSPERIPDFVSSMLAEYRQVHISLRSRILLTGCSESLPPYVEELMQIPSLQNQSRRVLLDLIESLLGKLYEMQLCPLGMMWQASMAIEKKFCHCSLQLL